MAMKRWVPLVALLLAAALVSGQESTPPGGARQGNDRQFAGEVVTTDVAGKTLTVKASGVDSSGQPLEKTMVMLVEDGVVPFLESLHAGDKVTVLWRRAEGGRPDIVIAIEKKDAASTGQQ